MNCIRAAFVGKVPDTASNLKRSYRAGGWVVALSSYVLLLQVKGAALPAIAVLALYLVVFFGALLFHCRTQSRTPDGARPGPALEPWFLARPLFQTTTLIQLVAYPLLTVVLVASHRWPWPCGEADYLPAQDEWDSFEVILVLIAFPLLTYMFELQALESPRKMMVVHHAITLAVYLAVCTSIQWETPTSRFGELFGLVLAAGVVATWPFFFQKQVESRWPQGGASVSLQWFFFAMEVLQRLYHWTVLVFVLIAGFADSDVHPAVVWVAIALAVAAIALQGSLTIDRNPKKRAADRAEKAAKSLTRGTTTRMGAPKPIQVTPAHRPTSSPDAAV